MLGTIDFCKQFRPKAKWGYYLFPDCYKKKSEVTCNEKQEKFTDEFVLLNISYNFICNKNVNHM